MIVRVPATIPPPRRSPPATRPARRWTNGRWPARLPEDLHQDHSRAAAARSWTRPDLAAPRGRAPGEDRRPHRREGGGDLPRAYGRSVAGGGPQPAAYFVAHSQFLAGLDPRRAGLGVTRLGDRRPHRPSAGGDARGHRPDPGVARDPGAPGRRGPGSRAPRWRTCRRLRERGAARSRACLRPQALALARLHGVRRSRRCRTARARVQARRGPRGGGPTPPTSCSFRARRCTRSLAAGSSPRGSRRSRRSRQPRATAPELLHATRSAARRRKAADLVVLDAKPGWGWGGGGGGADIAATRNIAWVMTCRIVRPDSLRAEWTKR